MTNRMTSRHSNAGPRLLKTGLAFLIAMVMVGPKGLWASALSSERLIQLPPQYIEQALEADFEASPIAGQWREAEQAVGDHLQSIEALQKQVAAAEGETQMDLRHQLLIKKSEYLDVMEQRHGLNRQKLARQNKLLRHAIQRLSENERAQKSISTQLVSQHRDALNRLEQSAADVDLSLFQAPLNEESHVAQYDDNLSLIQSLQQAVLEHQANGAPVVDGDYLTREEFLSHLLSNNQVSLNLLDQEQEILTYMAKLVALDAQVLQQEVQFSGVLDQGKAGAGSVSLSRAARLFLP